MSHRVLTCDDEFPIANAIAMKLKRGGFDVETCPDGQAAWEAYERCRPELLITDYQMPRLDGLNLIRRIRERDAALPVLLLTAKGYELDEAGLRTELGDLTLYVKPFSPREILLAVQQRLGVASGESSVVFS